jgi:hypothetical protein
MELFFRKIISWLSRDKLIKELFIATLDRALKQRKLPDDLSCILTWAVN